MTPELDRRTALRMALLAAVPNLIAHATDGCAAEPVTRLPARGVTDPLHDFDFFFGTWRAHHLRLKERLAHSTEWIEFDGTSVVQPLLGGRGNVDDNLINLPGGAYYGVTLRAFDARTRTWAIWWLDERFPQTIDAPVIGGFTNGVGNFFADDTLRGEPIKVRYRVSRLTPTTRRWEQAFSPDGGSNWETNWVTTFTRTGAPAAS
jgi:hypothetical protein